jgi:hypothetical protein
MAVKLNPILIEQFEAQLILKIAKLIKSTDLFLM